MAKYTVKKSAGHTFFFKHEPPDELLLHIYVRHLTSEVDAITAFFTGVATWNPKRERWETMSDTHTVFWFWMDESQKKVMIITCFSN